MNKNLSLLILSQIFAFTAAPVTVFLSGIIGSKFSPIKSLATLPMALSVVGIALFAFFAAKLMSIIGRKLGFENLTLAPIEKELINFNLLTKQEKNYLFKAGNKDKKK